MEIPFQHIGLDQPAHYVIKIQGRLTDDFSDWFQGQVTCTFETSETGEVITVLSGVILDQAALHGLLKHIRDMALALLLVDCVEAHRSDPANADAAHVDAEHPNAEQSNAAQSETKTPGESPDPSFINR